MGRNKLGKVKITLFGVYCEEFLTELFKNDISITSVRNRDNVITGWISVRDYIRARRFTRQYSVRMRITKRSRLVKFRMKYRRRYGLVGGFLGAFIVVTLLSWFVWDIDISGNERVSDLQLAEVLEDFNVKKGAYIYNVDNKFAELNAILRLKELSWISIQRVGSRVLVKVRERTDTQDVISDETPCNIVAAHDGQIVEVQVYSGKQVIPLGSGVAKGNIIVSGIVDDGSGTLYYRHADAKIIAEYTVEKSFYVPLSEIERVETSNKIKHNYLQILGFEIDMGANGEAFDSYTYSEETSRGNIFGIPLPFSVKTGIYTENADIVINRSEADAKKKIDTMESDYRINFLSDTQIISDELVYKPSDGGIYLEASYIVRSDIAVSQEISTDNGKNE